MKVKLSEVKDPEYQRISERYQDDELAGFDLLTPLYKQILESLSPQKRKILISLFYHGKPLRINQLTVYARMEQQNRTSAQVHGLVEEGFLSKQEDGRYWFNPEYPDLERYLVMRFDTRFQSLMRNDLIPDKKHPISYFIENRETLEDKLY